MNPVNFSEQNSIFVADGCGDLPACKQYNEQFQTDEVVSCWEFSDDEIIQILKEVKDGKRPQIFLSVVGGQPPVSLFMRMRENDCFENNYCNIGINLPWDICYSRRSAFGLHNSFRTCLHGKWRLWRRTLRRNCNGDVN